MPEGIPIGVKSLVKEIMDKQKQPSMPLVTDVMSEDEYDNSWVRSIARKGRSDEEMKALHPDLDAFRLGPDSDLVTYHKKPPQVS